MSTYICLLKLAQTVNVPYATFISLQTLNISFSQKSAIDSSSDEGECPSDIRGRIEFKNINFAYPSRPDVQVLK